MRRPLLKSHLVDSPAAKEMKEKINQMIWLISVESIFQVLKKRLGDFVLSQFVTLIPGNENPLN